MGNVFNLFKDKLLWLHPSYNLCVDETLYSFRGTVCITNFLNYFNFISKGKCSFRQYIPSKPARYGLKYWCIVDTDSSYLCDVDIYLGKAEESSQRETSIGMKVVLKLCELYYFTKRCITADNFFTSIALCQKLWEKNLIYLCILFI
jgi:hypothetical protein